MVEGKKEHYWWPVEAAKREANNLVEHHCTVCVRGGPKRRTIPLWSIKQPHRIAYRYHTGRYRASGDSFCILHTLSEPI